MWFYNDSLHTGSICFQRNPFKAALASHVYYFLSALADMYLFIWPFPTSKMHLTMFDFCPLTWIVVSEFFTRTVFNGLFSENDTKLKPLILSLLYLSFILCISCFNFCFFFFLSPPPFSAESHISTCFSSALLSLLVESQSA